jgi:hypothetical protein
MLEHYMKKHQDDRRNLIHNVALSGNLKALKWVVKPMDECTFDHAGESGNLKMLKWLHRKGCPWNWEVCCRSAEYSGHVEMLEMLQWLQSVGHDEEVSLSQSEYDEEASLSQSE